jgi:hypothetical protein
MDVAERASGSPVLLVPDITFAFDRLGREVAVIPDAVVAQMRLEVDRARGAGRFAQGTWMYRTARKLLSTYASSSVPRCSALRKQQALWERARARDHGLMYAFVVGQSEWDAEARWWKVPAGTRPKMLGRLHAYSDGYAFEPR